MKKKKETVKKESSKAGSKNGSKGINHTASPGRALRGSKAADHFNAHTEGMQPHSAFENAMKQFDQAASLLKL